MTEADMSVLKNTIARLTELVKYSTGKGEPSGSLSTTTDSPTTPPRTGTPLPIGGPKRPLKESKSKPPKDYAYGQRGKNEAGKTKPGITSLPSEPTKLLPNMYTEHGTPYTDDNL